MARLVQFGPGQAQLLAKDTDLPPLAALPLEEFLPLAGVEDGTGLEVICSKIYLGTPSTRSLSGRLALLLSVGMLLFSIISH